MDDDKPRHPVTPGGTPRSVLGVVHRRGPSLAWLTAETLRRGLPRGDLTVLREWEAEQERGDVEGGGPTRR